MALLKNLTKQQVITERVIKAQTFWERSKGLLGRDSLDPNTALWISQCPWIHTFFMRFTIDAVFVDRNLKVANIKKQILPNRITMPVLKANSVFEMAAGVAQEKNIHIGDQLYVGD